MLKFDRNGFCSMPSELLDLVPSLKDAERIMILGKVDPLTKKIYFMLKPIGPSPGDTLFYGILHHNSNHSLRIGILLPRVMRFPEKYQWSLKDETLCIVFSDY